jgi:hypothetical protein
MFEKPSRQCKYPSRQYKYPSRQCKYPRRQKAEKDQEPQSRLSNIRHHRVKYSRSGDLSHKICPPLLFFMSFLNLFAFFRIYYPLIILSLQAIYSETETASLNK